MALTSVVKKALTMIIQDVIIDIMEMVTIAKAALALGCTKANVYQRINHLGLKTQRRKITVKYCTTREVFAIHVDLDLLKRGGRNAEVQDSE